MKSIIVDERISIGPTVVQGNENLINLYNYNATIQDIKIFIERLHHIDDSLLVIVIFSAVEKMMRDAAHSYYQDPKQLDIRSLGMAIKHLRAFGCLDAELEERYEAFTSLRDVFACSSNSLSLDHPAIALRCHEIYKDLNEICVEALRKSPWFREASGVAQNDTHVNNLCFYISDKDNNVFITIEEVQDAEISIRDILISSASCFLLLAASLRNDAVAVAQRGS